MFVREGVLKERARKGRGGERNGGKQEMVRGRRREGFGGL